MYWSDPWGLEAEGAWQDAKQDHFMRAGKHLYRGALDFYLDNWALGALLTGASFWPATSEAVDVLDIGVGGLAGAAYLSGFSRHRTGEVAFNTSLAAGGIAIPIVGGRAIRYLSGGFDFFSSPLTDTFIEVGEDVSAAAKREGGPTQFKGRANKAATEYVDLTDFRRDHILNRHRAGAGKPGKTEFPSSWSDDKIIHEVSDIATDPNLSRTYTNHGSYVDGMRDGIKIRVVFYPENHARYPGQISTAYPTNVSSNP